VEKIRDEINKTQVVMLAGGKGKRMGMSNIPKALIEINGVSLIERQINILKNCGFNDFKILLGHQGKKVKKHLSKKKLGVCINYCYDPPVENVGKGKAIKNAILRKVIDEKHRSLVVLPDDVILDKTIPLRLLSVHLAAVERFKVLATILLAYGVTFPYGIAEIDTEGRVYRFIEKPLLPLKTNVGFYCVEPDVYNVVCELIDIENKAAIEFEPVVLKYLAHWEKLYGFVVPGDVWIPINTLKDLEYARSKIL